MASSQLSPLQRRVIDTLSGLGGVLTGGGALAGFHLGHRQTRDLDFFWHDRAQLGELPDEVIGRLRAAGLEAERQQTGTTFCRVRVSDGAESLPVDLVADQAPRIEAPVEVRPGVLVDTPHEILVNKLTAMLGRWAERDLIDVRALLDAGGDLDRALADAPRKDGGFSPETLAWVLDTTAHSGRADGGLAAFRQTLIARLLRP